MPLGLRAVRITIVGVVAAVVLTLILRAVTAPAPNAGALATARADLATLRNEVALADARTDIAEAEIAQADAHVLQATHRADLAEMRVSQLEQRFQVAASEAPDTCAPVIAAAEQALAAGDSAFRAKDDELTATLQREAIAKTALDSARVAFRRLGEGVVRVDSAVRVAQRAGSRWARLLPRPGLGVSAGIGEDSRPHTVAGVTFGWPL